MMALAFLRHYSGDELLVLGGIMVVILGLLGLMTHGIMQGRGFGIFGNAALVGLGGAVAVLAQSWLMSQPAIAALSLSGAPMLIGLLTACGTFVLLTAAYLKRHFA